MRPKGSVIVFEGIDSSGKTTIARYIEKILKGRNINTFLLESGGLAEDSIVAQIKKITHSPENKDLAETAETLLYLGRLAQRVQEYVIPALRENKIVLVDRFTMSVLVLAHYGRLQEREFILNIINFSTQGIKPTFTILCDLKEKTATERMLAVGKPLSRKESEGIELLKRCRNGYLQEAQLLRKDGGRIVIFRSDKLSKEDMLAKAKESVEEYLMEVKE